MYIILLLLIFLALAALFFLSRKLSPVPYFPTHKDDVSSVIKEMRLKNDHIVIDLGAGNGAVILKAAQEAHKKRLDTKFVAIEINPILVAVLFLRKLFHPNRKNISILMKDMFAFDYSTIQKSASLTVFAYVSPLHLERLYKQAKSAGRPVDFISYFYPLPKSLAKPSRNVKNKNSIFCYHIDWPVKPLDNLVG